MRALITTCLLSVLIAGCVTPAPRTLVQSALADTHLGWQPAPKNQLAFSIATATGIARVELRALPRNLELLTLELPGMQKVEGVQWHGEDGNHGMLFSGNAGEEGILLERRGHGFRLQISGPALDRVRAGGELTVVDFYRG